MIDLLEMQSSFSRVLSAAVIDDVDQRTRDEVEVLVHATARLKALAESVHLKALTRLDSLADAQAQAQAQTNANDSANGKTSADSRAAAGQAPGRGGGDPDALFAQHGRRRDTDADRARARTITEIPQLDEALVSGAISPAHVDVVTQTLRRLEPEDRAALVREGRWIALIAKHSTPDELERTLRRRAREITAARATERFERQRRATTLRHWTDKDSGMLCFRGELDPEHGAAFVQLLEAAMDRLFADTVPDTCPTDERKWGHLRALALMDLISRPSGQGGRAVPEMIIVVDHDTIRDGVHEHSHITVTGDVDLPVDTLRRLACEADLVPAVLDSRGVVLDVGRSRRLATVHQRRALRVMYDTCAIPGCGAVFDHCRIHHLHWWEHDGPTDLANLLPLCSRHHHAAHEGGWQLGLDADRRLTIATPDGHTRVHPPPLARSA